MSRYRAKIPVLSLLVVMLQPMSVAWAHTIGWPAKRLDQLYPGAESFKEIKKNLSSDMAARIKQAVGTQFNKWDESPSFYVPIGTKPDGRKGALALVYIVDAEGQNGTIEMGLAVTLKGRVIRVVLFENKEPRAINAESFLQQFAGMTLTADSYQSPEALIRRGATPLSGEDKALLEFLEEHRAIMQRQGRHFKELERLLGRKQLQEDHLGLLETDLRSYEALLDARSSPLPVAEMEELKRKAKTTAGNLAALKQAMPAGEWDVINARFDVLAVSCDQCHAVYQTNYQAKIKLISPGGRFAGHFVVGRDITAPKGAETSAQAIGTAVKKGLMMMKELF